MVPSTEPPVKVYFTAADCTRSSLRDVKLIDATFTVSEKWSTKMPVFRSKLTKLCSVGDVASMLKPTASLLLTGNTRFPEVSRKVVLTKEM